MLQGIGQPFAPASQSYPTVPAPTNGLALITRALPTLLLVAWLSGFAAVLFFWLSRVRRMAAATRGAVPMQSGREFDTLRCLERQAGLANPVGLIISKSALEPGILGIFRQILVVPSGISDRLTLAQLEAILAHELCHVLRRDNLAAALHMLVEALFWFHPLVWWLGARLVDERERACDEDVLRRGSDPQVYAESILKVCEFYLESPLFCAAGVTGSNLKKRIEVIMLHRTPVNLSFGRKLVLSSVGFIAVAVPFVFGLLHATQTRAQSQPLDKGETAAVFESVSIHEDKTASGMFGFGWFSSETFTANGATLQQLIREAYGVEDDQILGGPDWVRTGRYDIKAKMAGGVADELRKLNTDEGEFAYLHTLQPLLADRFKLALHHETRQVPAYVLVVAENGPKLQEAKPGDTYPNGMKDLDGHGHGDIMRFGRGLLTGQGISIRQLVKGLSKQHLDRLVVDNTGLKGKYDFTLQWTPDVSGSAGPSLFQALEEQLGLKLEPRESPVEVLVIDNIEKPSEN